MSERSYDDAQVSPRPCTCARLVSRPEMCAAWRAERQTDRRPMAQFHGPRQRQTEAA